MTDDFTPGQFRITETGSYVKIGYRVRVMDGRVLKGAAKPEIMDFVTGYLHVIPGLEKRLIGHCRGESLSFTIPPEEAFGARRADLVIEKSKADFHFPNRLEPYPGMEIPLVSGSENAPDTVIIREVKEKSIVIDLNHPLAGAALRYDLQILEARAAKPTEVCSEWESRSDGCASCPSVPEIVIGNDIHDRD